MSTERLAPKASVCAELCSCGEYLRIRAAPAQFELCAISQWTSQFFGSSWPEPDAQRWQLWDRLHPPKVPTHNHDGARGNFLPHVYMPWWKFERKNAFLRGYHIDSGGGRFMPVVGDFDEVCDRFEGYGSSLKENCKRFYGTTIDMEGLGEMIPNENTHCELDPTAVDEWGIPVLRFHRKAGENEIKMVKDMQETFRSIVEAGA